jgi:hypothetical protein
MYPLTRSTSRARFFGAAPSLLLDFLSGSLDSRITFTRASNATQFDSAGSLVYAPNNAIRNNTMVGAVAGTPGTAPTNWARAASPTNGISSQVVGTGTESGVTYLDLRFTGTCSATFGFSVDTDTSSAAAAATGQAWTSSVYLTRSAGTIGNATVQLVLNEYSSVPAFLRNTFSSSVVPAASNLATQRVTQTVTVGASTAFVQQSLSVNFTNGSTYDFTLRIGMPQLEIGPSATAVNATSGTAYYGPRFDYNPATLAPLGLLIEESRTNLLLRSEDFSDASWVKIRATVTVNATTAPTGTAVADKLVEDTSTNTHESYQSVTIVANTLHTATFYLKAAERTRAKIWLLNGAISSGANASVNLGAGTITAPNLFGTGSSASSSITNVGNGWYRCSIACIVDAASTTARAYIVLENAAGNDNYTGDGTSGLFVWGAQLEAGAFPTSYIPTTTTALTRAADVASVNTLSPWFNAVEGTLYAELTASANTATAYVTLSDGTQTSNSTYFDNDSGNIRNVVFSGASAVAVIGLGAIGSVGAINKVASAYRVNDFAAVRNGGSVGTDTSGAVPVGVSQMNIGASTSGVAVSYINGYLRRITYYPRKLSSAELQAITT